MLLTVGIFVVSYLKKTKNQIRKKLTKYSKKYEVVPLLNFKAGPEVQLLNFEGGPESWVSSPTFTPCSYEFASKTRKYIAFPIIYIFAIDNMIYPKF